MCETRVAVIAGAVDQVSAWSDFHGVEYVPSKPPATSTVPSGRSDAVCACSGSIQTTERRPRTNIVTGSTVTVVAPDTFPRVAVIVALPIPVPVTRPGLPVLATVAIVSDDEIQLAKMRS